MGWFRNLGNDRPWAQGCVIAASGAALAGTSCFGFLLTIDSATANSSFGELFTFAAGAFFCLSALAVPVGFIWFIVGLVKNSTKDRARSPVSPPSQPPPPPPGVDAGDGPAA